MGKLKIDQADLVMAVEGSGNMRFFLDRETGDVLALTEPGDVEEDGGIWSEMEGGTGRYVEIERIPSHDGYRVMERFARGLPDGRARERLMRALDRPRPFRSFKDALHDFPDLLQQWHAWHETELKDEALAQLRALGIDAELVNKYAQGGGGTPPA